MIKNCAKCKKEFKAIFPEVEKYCNECTTKAMENFFPHMKKMFMLDHVLTEEEIRNAIKTLQSAEPVEDFKEPIVSPYFK